MKFHTLFLTERTQGADNIPHAITFLGHRRDFFFNLGCGRSGANLHVIQCHIHL